ncbi:MAG: hypothetical protein GXO94_02770 [Nitrospirae bacterium]|nr:hypothetical protein [Nitrospirota bacterium]
MSPDRYGDTAGVVPGRPEGRAVLRIRALEPYSSEFTSEQIGVIADIAEKYGSGIVHVTPRQTVEVPDIDNSSIGKIAELLGACGLSLGSTGRHMRNVIACSRWCLYNAVPVSDLARKLNSLHAGRVLPGKMDISLSGCDFSCVRSRTSDIGVIARADIELTDKECKKCSLCVKAPLGCQVDAINLSDGGLTIDRDRCVRCGFCSNICRPGTIEVRSRSFDVYVGGCGGIRPREAVFHKSLDSEEALVDELGRILDRYAEHGWEGARIGDVIEKKGTSFLEG